MTEQQQAAVEATMHVHAQAIALAITSNALRQVLWIQQAALRDAVLVEVRRALEQAAGEFDAGAFAHLVPHSAEAMLIADTWREAVEGLASKLLARISAGITAHERAGLLGRA